MSSTNPIESADSQPTPVQSNDPPPLTHDSPLASAIEPSLRATCEGRLSTISWFRTDWQRGGALTGYATYREDGKENQVVVKVPVKPVERTWLRRMQSHDVAPKLFADGDDAGGYDLIWVVMERLPHGPLGTAWGGHAFDLIVESLGRFYQAASAYPIEGEARNRDWNAILKLSRDRIKQYNIPNQPRWNKALKAAQKKLPAWVDLWHDRPIRDWCHGDVHLGNAMTREPAPNGPALLFDFALTRPGHWLEDAVFFEHLYWSQRDLLEGRKLTKMIAHERKRLGLPVQKNWSKLAQVRRTLIALATPATLDQRGDAAHLDASLEMLEREI